MSPALGRPPRDTRSWRATNLAGACKLAGVTQADLARDLVVNPSLITRYVKGEAVSRERAERIASFLGCPVEQVFAPVNP